MNPFNMQGQKILITGASSGIGKAIANKLALLGARLVLVARNRDRLQDVAASLPGANHLCCPVDLTQTNDLSSLFAQATEDGQKLKGLVHSAGISQVLPLHMLTRERIEGEMTLNYYAFIELCRQYAMAKHNDGGSIVAISSIAADRAEKCQTNYAASKAAMDRAAQALAIELAPKGIRINTILPGVTNTPLALDENVNGRDISNITKKQLLGAAEPEDIANACIFLLSDLARMITGRRLYVDGGRII